MPGIYEGVTAHLAALLAALLADVEPASSAPELRAAAQLQAELALKRRNLTLWRAPRATLRHFCANAASAAFRGLAWTAHHPLTLFIALPVLIAYLFFKYSGTATSYTVVGNTHCVGVTTSFR